MCNRGQDWPWTPGQGAPIVASNGQRWVMTGDSITTVASAFGVGWFEGTGGFREQLNTLIGGTIDVVNTGQAGYQAVEMASQVHSRVGVYSPDVVAITIGLNDIRVASSAARIAAAMESILYGVRAECPSAQILMLGMWLFGEQWLSGPLRWAPAADHNIDTVNALTAALCTTYGAVYADVRGPTLIYESLNNTPEPGVVSGVLTNDGEGIHPDTAASKVVFGDAVIPYVVAA